MSISNEMDVQTNVVRPDNGREEARGADARPTGTDLTPARPAQAQSATGV